MGVSPKSNDSAPNLWDDVDLDVEDEAVETEDDAVDSVHHPLGKVPDDLIPIELTKIEPSNNRASIGDAPFWMGLFKAGDSIYWGTHTATRILMICRNSDVIRDNRKISYHGKTTAKKKRTSDVTYFPSCVVYGIPEAEKDEIDPQEVEPRPEGEAFEYGDWVYLLVSLKDLLTREPRNIPTYVFNEEQLISYSGDFFSVS